MHGPLASLVLLVVMYCLDGILFVLHSQRRLVLFGMFLCLCCHAADDGTWRNCYLYALGSEAKKK